MGKVDRLPGSRSLGPVVGRETRLDQGSPKANERALGSLMSVMRASRPGAVPASLRQEGISEHQANLHAAEQLSDYLQGIRPDFVETVSTSVGEVVVFVAGEPAKPTMENVADALFCAYDPYWKAESMKAAGVNGAVAGDEALFNGVDLPESLKSLRVVEEASVLEDEQGLFDYGTTARDLRE